MKIDRTARLFVTVGQDRTWSSPRHVELLKIWQAGDAMVTHLMPWKKVQRHGSKRPINLSTKEKSPELSALCRAI